MENKDDILKGRFISRILREEGQNIESAKLDVVSTFSSREKFTADYKNNDTTLTMTHPKKLRFVDMKTRNTTKGKIRKVAHPVHNSIIFGHLNNVIRRVSYEYSSEMKAMLMKEYPMDV